MARLKVASRFRIDPRPSIGSLQKDRRPTTIDTLFTNFTTCAARWGYFVGLRLYRATAGKFDGVSCVLEWAPQFVF